MTSLMTNRLPIPWNLQSSDMGSLWTWDTALFQVTITGDNRSFYWNMTDVASRRVFADGQARRFGEAEDMVRETIGKAYPVDAGYASYAGDLATTFTLATGHRVDLAAYIGRPVTVTVIQRDERTVEYSGVAAVDHYDLVLTQGTAAVRITPTFIQAITLVEEPVATTTTRTSTRYASPPSRGTLRTGKGKITRGCTGKAGFLPGTVDHAGPACPVHER